MGPLPVILRFPIYVLLWIFSVLLFILTCVRLGYTTHLAPTDPLNGGRSFFDPIVVELLVDSILALSSIPIVFKWIGPFSQSTTTNNLLELGALAVVWLLWLVGSVVSTSIWPDLSFCSNLAPCRVLTAMMAFAWLGWIALTALAVLALLAATSKVRPPPAPMMVEWADTGSIGRGRGLSRVTV